MIIPGQSLTAEPKNAPYENPPQMNTEDEAVLWHLNRLAEPERFDSLLDMLELGVDVVSLTEGILRGAVLEGRHSIDISLIIAPVIHEFIVSYAERVGIDFEEGLPDNSEQKANIRYIINETKAKKELERLDMEVDDEMVEDATNMTSEEEQEDTLVTDLELKRDGLMSRSKGELK